MLSIYTFYGGYNIYLYELVFKYYEDKLKLKKMSTM